jgi:hypothetical protein
MALAGVGCAANTDANRDQGKLTNGVINGIVCYKHQLVWKLISII